ncbi:endonuclease/exonuclease/phosphatase family protein [Acidovorax sp. JG5]|nr:endonuclease/exonuclease/phosphatase family protein [Acidovorax sp. JG5]
MQWALELISHWHWIYLVVGITCFTVLVIAKRAWWPLIPSLVLGASFFVQSATLDRSTEPMGSKPVLQVGTANLNFDTTDFSALVGWLVSGEAPDVVFLQEFTGQAQQTLQSPELAQRYPHRVEAPQPDQFGLAILSRYPLSEVQKVEPADMQATLRLRATVIWAGGPVSLSAIHPMPPLNAVYAQLRDQALVEEAHRLSQSGGLALMAGDFNTTPWAKGLFAIDSQLKRANALAGSWPNAFGWLSVLPLDHVLASSGWQLVDSGHGPDLGSDHRPVVVQLVAR